jgi:hypothetical protein
VRLAAILTLALAATACAAAHAEDPGYELRVAPDVTIELDTTASFSVAIVPATGRTVSAAGPVRVAVDAPDALAVPRRRYARKDAADPAADAPRFDIRLKARAAGEHTVTLDVRFWLCGKRVCRPVETTRTVRVMVRTQAPAIPPIDAAPSAPVDAAPPVDAPRPARPRAR